MTVHDISNRLQLPYQLEWSNLELLFIDARQAFWDCLSNIKWVQKTLNGLDICFNASYGGTNRPAALISELSVRRKVLRLPREELLPFKRQCIYSCIGQCSFGFVKMVSVHGKVDKSAPSFGDLDEENRFGRKNPDDGVSNLFGLNRIRYFGTI